MNQPEYPNGLQQERTLLAWRRSSLSLFVTALVMSRLAFEDSAATAVIVSIAAAVVALGTTAASLRERRWNAPSMLEPEFEHLLCNGILPAMLAVIAGSLSLVELALSLGLDG